MSRSALIGSACGAVLLLAAGAAAAQEKIAPTRSYSRDTASGSYSDGRKEKPDKTYGLPSFGVPDAQLPQQRTAVSREEPPHAGGSSIPKPPEATEPSFDMPGPTSARPAPGYNESSSEPDFFPKSDTFDLPPPARSSASGGSDTPLFTTPDESGATSGGNAGTAGGGVGGD